MKAPFITMDTDHATCVRFPLESGRQSGEVLDSCCHWGRARTWRVLTSSPEQITIMVNSCLLKQKNPFYLERTIVVVSSFHLEWRGRDPVKMIRAFLYTHLLSYLCSSGIQFNTSCNPSCYFYSNFVLPWCLVHVPTCVHGFPTVWPLPLSLDKTEHARTGIVLSTDDERDKKPDTTTLFLLEIDWKPSNSREIRRPAALVPKLHAPVAISKKDAGVDKPSSSGLQC